MSEELTLLPCPFCGSEPEVREPAFKGLAFKIACSGDCNDDDVDMGAIWRNGDTFEEAAARWNRRAPTAVSASVGAGEAESLFREYVARSSKVFSNACDRAVRAIHEGQSKEYAAAALSDAIEYQVEELNRLEHLIIETLRAEQAPPQPSEPEYDQMLHPTFARITRAAHSPVSQSATGGTFTKLVDEVIACVREYDSVDHELGAYAFVEARREKLRVARAALEAAYQQVVRDSERLGWIQTYAPDIDYKMDLRVVGLRNWHVRVSHTVGGDPVVGVSPDIREAIDLAMAATIPQPIEQRSVKQEDSE